ncbi:LysR family transcriptional regulator [Roseomonas mucosa]
MVPPLAPVPVAALDVLLAEASVTGAARRLGLSPSAMSRTLTRLRTATGDPLLVRAGRGLVPTPRAAELRDRVHELAREARAVLRPQPARVDIASLERSFTIRASEGFLEVLSAPVVAAVARAAPQVQLRFVPKPDKEAGPLREGLIDLEIGLRGTRAEDHRRRARLSGCHADRAPLGLGGAGAGVPDLGDVASRPGRRSGASLAARDGGDGCQQAYSGR